MHIEPFIPAVLCLLSFVGALLFVFKGPRKRSTLLLSAAFLALAARESAAFSLLEFGSAASVRLFFSLEAAFVALWSTGLLYSFKPPRSSGKLVTFLAGATLASGCALTLFTAVSPQEVFVYSLSTGQVLFVGWLGRLDGLYLLLPSLVVLWRLESVFHQGSPPERHMIKYPVLGVFIVSGVIIFQAGLRLTYRVVEPAHLPLYSAMLIIGLGLFLFFVVRHKLFDLDIFVSRYIVYKSFGLTFVGLYLLALGVIGLGIRYLGFSVPFIVKWMFIFVTGLCTVVILLSTDVRRRVKHYVNTHFFENKYDYRYEWTRFSDLLSRATTRNEVLQSLQAILEESMFSKGIDLWVKDESGYATPLKPKGSTPDRVPPDEPFVAFMQRCSFFLANDPDAENTPAESRLPHEAENFVQIHDVHLAVPLKCGEEFFGLVTLNQELTGQPYARDDIDLVTAICSQASVALMSIKLGEDLGGARELALLNKLNAFVLHDLKNAASLLSLLTQSAHEHISNPEYQEDLLEAIRNAHQRVQKAMNRLQFPTSSEKHEMEPCALSQQVASFCESMVGRWQGIRLDWSVEPNLRINGVPVWITTILENLFLNAKDASRDQGRIELALFSKNHRAIIKLSDNGIGMSCDFLKNRLFKPFHSNKPNGLGIGLWQVRHYTELMGGTIDVRSEVDEGAAFTIELPLSCD